MSTRSIEMNRIKKYVLLTQMRTNLALSLLLNIGLLSYLFFGFVGLGILIIATPLARLIEEKMGHSYYQEELDEEFPKEK